MTTIDLTREEIRRIAIALTKTDDVHLAILAIRFHTLWAQEETPVDKGPRGAAQRYADGLNSFEAQRPVESWHLAEAKRLGKPLPTNGAHIVYTVDKPGRRYTRIVETWTSGGNRSVHAFVENATGYVFKAAGWKAPAKIMRFSSVERALAKAGEHPLQAFNGGYLYIR
jgi:hypothetical protein